MNNKYQQSRMFKSGPTFKLSVIASAMLAIPVSTSVLAAEIDNKEAEVEVIEVTGVRGDLLNAQNMKREGDTVLDAISAKDIGALPDRSVLEAIVRLPGVSIERFAGANDPDHFSTEGSGIVVRGLTHTRSEFNGRDSFTADSGRGLSFQDVPPELMGGVEVYKNQSADMIEGGIAGTVNLITRKPFDSDKRVLAFTVDGTYGDFRKETTPSFSGLYSDIFDLESGGRFGVLFNYSNSELKAQSDGTQIGRYEDQNQLVNGEKIRAPRTMRLTRKQDDREREGFASALQWENESGTVLATAQYIRSDSSLAWTENAIEMGDDAVINDLIPVAGTEFEVSDQGLFESGLITSTAGWRGNDADRQPGGVFGAQHAVITRDRTQEAVVDDYAFNVRYRPNDTWAFNVDLQYVNSTSKILDYSVMGATRSVVGINQSGSDIANITLLDPSYTGENQGDANYLTDPHNYFWRSAMDHASDNEGDELAFTTDAKYTFDNGFFSSIKIGIRHAEREQITRQSTYNWKVLSEAWAGGNAWFDAEGDELGASLTNQYEKISFDNFARGGILNTAGESAFLFPKAELVAGYDTAESKFSGLSGSEWKQLANRDGTVGTFLPNEINDTKETNNAIYIKANFEGEIGDMDYSGNVGLRYVSIENDVDGFIKFPDNTAIPGDETDRDNYLPADQAAFGNNAAFEQSASSKYTNVLPSLNIKLNLSEDLLVRFGFSEGIALPDLGNLRNYVEIQAEDQVNTFDENANPPQLIGSNIGRYIAKSGNPYLKPMEAYNYDLAFEWYFSEGVGSVTTSFFYKDLSNYFINGSVDREFTNNGSTQIVEVDGATNGDEGSVKGVEFAYQQFFDFLPGAFSGLGVQFNYTYIEEEGSPNSALAPDKPNSEEGEGIAFDNVPLEGLSKDNLNFIAMYEKNGVAARLAYNWRSEYLLTTKDVITALPIYSEAGGQLDGSVFYDLNDNIKIGLQGTNLTNTVSRTSMQIDNERNQAARSWFVNDRRYSFVIKGNF